MHRTAKSRVKNFLQKGSNTESTARAACLGLSTKSKHIGYYYRLTVIISRGNVDLLKITVKAKAYVAQSCPWVGLTRGLGWAGLGWVGSLSEIVVFSGLSWVMGLKWLIFEN